MNRLYDASEGIYSDNRNPQSRRNRISSRSLFTRFLRGLSKLGLTDGLFVDIDGLPEDLKEIKVAMALKNLNNLDMKLEMQSMSENGRLLKEKGNLGDLPMLVISATNNGYKNWEQTQSELLLLSSRATHVVFPNTKHYIHHVKSEQIIEEIKKFIDFHLNSQQQTIIQE